MNIDFVKFIEARIEFFGISGWEYRFIETDEFSKETLDRFVNEFKEKVSRVFPNADFDKFEL